MMGKEGGETDQGKIGELPLSPSEVENHTFCKQESSQGFLASF